ncbi:MAG: hypothetical protein O3A96_09975 [Proteobacteria bacterium]|nr:hypothetical protein [Pseudomonadota bacterium]
MVDNEPTDTIHDDDLMDEALDRAGGEKFTQFCLPGPHPHISVR